MKLPAPLLGTLILVLLAGLAGWWWQPGIAVAQLSASSLLAHVGILLLTALFVERASEVVLTHWRAESSEMLALSLRVAEEQAQTQGDDAEPRRAHWAELQRQQLNHRARTRILAMRLGLGLGFMVAVAGVRAMAPLCDTADLIASQQWFFHSLDILLTAALIAGGSDGVHKLAEVYRVFLEGQTARARRAKRDWQ